MEALHEILARVSTFKESYIYNHSLIDPYLLASHGFVISTASQQSPQLAVCSHPGCELQIELSADRSSEPHLNLEAILKDHDEDCPFKAIKGTAINRETIQRLGLQIYEEAITNIRSQQKHIQLAPSEVQAALNIPKQPQNGPPSLNISLELFKKLDPFLSGGQVLKVRSSIMLAVFGWQYSAVNDNELHCQFCNSSVNVFEFISPSQCTLMNLSQGFCFMSSHKPWCCLVADSLWRETLKQAVLRGLQVVKGQAITSQREAQRKELKARAVKVYSQHQPRLMAIKRRLQDFKVCVANTYESGNELSNDFGGAISKLEGALESSREQMEGIIRGISEN